jgi:hypothetical protein
LDDDLIFEPIGSQVDRHFDEAYFEAKGVGEGPAFFEEGIFDGIVE